MERFKYIKEKNFSALPKTPGVYVFVSHDSGLPRRRSAPPRNDGAGVIYIGKAINLRERVKNHFFQPSYRDDIFISKVSKIGFFETGSEIDALLLEARLIKKYQPKFNVVWRDDKNYFYVAIARNKNKIPYVFITHQPRSPVIPGLTRNPGVSAQTLDSGFRQNDKTKYIGPFVEGTALKKTLKYLRRAFPFYTSATHPKNKCTWCHLDLCPGPTPDLVLYKKNIKQLSLVLQGKKKTALRSLKTEMTKLAKENKFEEAGKIRDRINALGQILSHAHVFQNGSTLEADQKYVPRPVLGSLAKIIRLDEISRIECYDVSNIQGKNATASMVVFTNGQPDKNEYRKFKIRLMDTPNDIAMLKEAISRRMSHPEWPYPDVMLIDGGKAQLNVAISAIRSHRVIPGLTRNPGVSAQTLDSGFRQNDKQIKVVSIAKGKQELYIEGREKPIPLKDLPQEVYNLIKHLDDEAHRFAITYHKTLRRKNLLS